MNEKSSYSLLQLGYFAIIEFGLIFLNYFLSYLSTPKFMARSISQYNYYIFDRLRSKSIGAFKREELANAIKLACLDKLVLDKDSNYSYFENGCNLSGGEK